MSLFPHFSVALALATLAGGVPAQATPVKREVNVQPAKVVPSPQRKADQGSADREATAEVAGPLPAPKATGVQGPFGPAPNSWFKETKKDLGSFLEGETAIGKFAFENPTDETQRLSNLSPNCQCAKAKIFVGDRRYVIENQPTPQTIYRLEGDGDAITRTKVKHIAVASHEQGHVELHLDLKGVKGRKEAFISMRTTDPALPMTTVSVRANGVTLLKVVPPDVNLNKMAWSEQREFSFEVFSDVRDDFEVTQVEPTVEALKITSQEKVMRNGKAVWQFKGTYGPDIDPRAGGGVIKVHTDIKPSEAADTGIVKDVRVIAVITGPMTLRPGTFLPFGRVKRDEGASKTVEFEANDNFDLQFTGVSFENLSIDEKWLAHESSKDGNILKLEIKILPGAPSRLIRGDVHVKLNHPAITEKVLQFNGFVR